MKNILYILLSILSLTSYAQSTDATLLGLSTTVKTNPPSSVKTGAALDAIINSKVNYIGAYTAGGTDTYTATVNPGIVSYVANTTYDIRFTNANTGAATLNLNGLGAIPLKKNVTGALSSGDLAANSGHRVLYDGTNFQVLTISSAGGGGTVTSVSGTANQIASTGGATPVLSLVTNTALPGAPTAATAATTVNNTQIASTAFVQNRILEAYAGSGTDTYTVTVNGITAYAAGQVFDVTFPNTNTTSATLNVNSLGAKTLKKHALANLVSGDIIPNMPYRLYYNGTDLLMYNQLLERVYNVEAYGAKHDYQTVSDAGVTSGTATLTSATAAFTTNDTGKSIRVSGAGAAGIDLLTTITFVNSTTVTLAVNASTTISAKRIEWGSDDTNEIQVAINDCFVRGGGTVYFPNGTYFLAGPLIVSIDGINPNAQLYIPLSNDATILKVVRLLGESSPILSRGPFADQGEPTTGVILKSVIVGSGTLPRVIGSSFAFDGFANANKTVAFFENIAIRVPSMVGVTHTASTMSAAILFELQAKQVTNCYAYIESTPTLSVVPTNVTYGWWLSAQGHSDNHSHYENVIATGFYYGFRIEEHDTWSHLNAYTCLHAAAIGGNATGFHPIIGGGVITAHWCRYGLAFLQNRTVDINYYAERWPGSFGTKWFDGVADIYVPSTVAINGKIRGTSENAGGTVANLVVSGTYTGNLVIEDIKAMPVFTYTAQKMSIATNATGLQVNSTNNDGISSVSSGAGSRGGFFGKNTTTTGQASIYLEGDVNTNYAFMGTQNSAFAGSLGGVTRANRSYLFSDGSTSAGLAVGTVTNDPINIFTQNISRFAISGAGDMGLERTVTAAGTTGARTINQMAGVVNFAAGASTLVVTNSLATTSSIILVQVLGVDTTPKYATVTRASGSFTITLNAAAVAELPVAFWLTN